MRDYAYFLSCFKAFASERNIPWAIIGSHALVAHSVLAGIPPRRAAHDLDLIAFLPRFYDSDFRSWLGRRSRWVYDADALQAIHFQCDDKSWVDLFTKSTVGEIDRSVQGVVFGGTYRIAGRSDVQTALDNWAEGAKNPAHDKHQDQPKYQADADWFRLNFPT